MMAPSVLCSKRFLGRRGRRHSACRIPDYGSTGRDVTRYDAACANDGIIANGDARQNDGLRSYPHVFPDVDGLAHFQARRAIRGVTRVIGGDNLDGRANLCA